METQVADPEKAQQVDGQPTPNSIPNHSTIQLSNHSNSLTVISIAIFILLALGTVVFFYYQNQELKQMLAKVNTPSPTPVATEGPFSNWKTSTNTYDNYEFKVPKEWKEIEHSSNFPHQSIFQSTDGLYRFTVDAQDNKNKVTGKPYSSLDGFIGLPYNVKTLVVDNIDARQSMPRAGSEDFNKVYFFSTDSKLIFSLELLVGDGSGTDHRVTVEARQIGADIFNKIISTFKFTSKESEGSNTPTQAESSPSAVACTMEAKICPDGSSVGRSGPNCEFAPCPTTP